MKRLLLLLCLLLAVAPASAVDLNLTLVGVSGGGPTYTGPIDIVASPTAWYGLRAGSGAIAAAGTQKLVTVRRASDNVACDFLVASSGGFGVTTATCNSSTQGGVSYGTFVGTDATGTCTIATTTLSCTGLGSALHANDLITGSGITNPCILSSPGSLVGGAQTATAQIAGTSTSCGTVSVGETVVAQVAGFVGTWYDQSGHATNATQATTADQPQLLPSCLNAAPCIYFSGNTVVQLSAAVSGTQPLAYSSVSIRTGAFTANGDIIRGNAPTDAFDRYSSTTGTMDFFAGSNVNKPATNSVWHAVQVAFSGASSTYNIDGTAATIGPGTNNLSSPISIGNGFSSTEPLTGELTELGIWPGATSAGNQTTICKNQQAFSVAGNFGAAC